MEFSPHLYQPVVLTYSQPPHHAVKTRVLALSRCVEKNEESIRNDLNQFCDISRGGILGTQVKATWCFLRRQQEH